MGEPNEESEPVNAGDKSGISEGATPVIEPQEVPQPKSTELIDKANEAAARLERANIEHAKIVARQESMQIKETLGGKADAGQPQKEATPGEYVKQVMAGEVKNDKIA